MAAANKKAELPLCPNCGQRRLVRNGKSPDGVQRYVCLGERPRGGKAVYCYSTRNLTALAAKGRDGRENTAPKKFHRKLERRTIVITAAQNATPIHEEFFAALQTFCRANDAELIVIPSRYKNPTSRWTASQENAERWAPEVEPYLYNQRKKLNSNLTLMGDIKIQPTAVRPLMGLEGMTHGESCIIGHPKLQMTTVPTPQNKLPKVMTTTGAVTVKNYTDSRAGKGGEFHHVFGAVVVEIDSRTVFHLRHVNARQDGAFIDLDRAYFADGRVETAPPYEALVFGDAHYRFADPQVVKGTFGAGGLVERLNPKRLVWHDLLDAYAVSPHHVGNPFISIAKRDAGFDNIEREMKDTIAWMLKKAGGRPSYIVASNHDDMLSRWILREDWRQDPGNAAFYLETALHMARSAKMAEGGAQYLDPFGYWIERLKPKGAQVRALRRNESLTIADIECSLHGDRGPSGARGSRVNLRRIGARTIIGHSHSPGIEEGCYQTGTMSRLNLEYNDGPSGWMHTHCSIDAFGKRHLHTFIQGRFCIK